MCVREIKRDRGAKEVQREVKSEVKARSRARSERQRKSDREGQESERETERERERERERAERSRGRALSKSKITTYRPIGNEEAEVLDESLGGEQELLGLLVGRVLCNGLGRKGSHLHLHVPQIPAHFQQLIHSHRVCKPMHRNANATAARQHPCFWTPW